MRSKPSNLIYGVDEHPPLHVLLVLALEHISVVSLGFVFPVVVVQEAGGTMVQAATMIQMSMIAGGVGTILQSLRRGAVGSGYLCPQVCGPSFLSASVLVGRAAGLGGVVAGTFFGGFFESLFSRVIKRLRRFFPPEVAGTVVTMVGITVIPFAMPRFLGLSEADPTVKAFDIIVAVVTLATICAVTVWGKKRLRLYNIIIGMAVGYLLSYVLGILTPEHAEELSSAAFFALPAPAVHRWQISWGIVLPFIVASLCSSLKTVGDVATCQKINDTEWSHMDMDSVSGGLLADAASCMGAGLLGGMGQSSSSSNVALSLATGATSRRVAWSIGLLLCALAFFPKLATAFVIMPAPVIGATLVFAVSFMVVVGIQIITSRMLDIRRILVVGLSIILGLSVDMVPNAYAGVPGWLNPIFSSSLSLTTISAVVLNSVFRFGTATRKSLILKPSAASTETVYDFMDSCGREWGARPAVIARATRIIAELLETCSLAQLTTDDISAKLTFDDFNLDIVLSYEGQPPDFSAEAPAIEQIVDDDAALTRLSAEIIRRTADRMSCEQKQGRTILRVHLDH